ncbi:MAG: hypothetical protein K0Q52_123 [Microbacterium sp.]|jgi:hypothetical protein|nr:hypothetical protein [Microbacterium sp.]
MGVLATVDGDPIELQAYSVVEASTPLSVDDSTGQVGSFTMALPTGSDARTHLLMQGAPVRLADTRNGFTVGTLQGVGQTADTHLTALTSLSRLADLNIYYVTAAPFAGTLGAAFAYYFSLAGITSGFRIEPAIANKQVAIIGWSGELWFHLKSLAAAHMAEISLVSGSIIVRPVRQREAIPGRDTARARALPGTQLARAIEVYHYETEEIFDRLVYPIGGWSTEAPILSVNAGEVTEQTLEIEGSLTSVRQPQFRASVGPQYDAESVYTIVGDDGLPVTEAAWKAGGGYLEVSIAEDTQSLILRARGATGVGNLNKEAIKVFSIAMASNSGSNSYSSLRILGSGIAFRKTKYTIPTGVAPQRTSQEVGITVDNPFLTSIGDVYAAGNRVARRYSGRALGLSGSVTAINQIGDRGVAKLPTVREVQATFEGLTNAQVEAHPINAGKTNAQIREFWLSTMQGEYENQTFGNVGGARVWDEGSRRFYRIRNATTTPDGISFDAEDDLTNADMQARLQGLTNAQVTALFAGKTNAQVVLGGVPL